MVVLIPIPTYFLITHKYDKFSSHHLSFELVQKEFERNYSGVFIFTMLRRHRLFILSCLCSPLLLQQELHHNPVVL